MTDFYADYKLLMQALAAQDETAAKHLLLSLLVIQEELHDSPIVNLLRQLTALEDMGQGVTVVQLLDLADQLYHDGQMSPTQANAYLLLRFRFARLDMVTDYTPLALKFLSSFEFATLPFLFPIVSAM